MDSDFDKILMNTGYARVHASVEKNDSMVVHYSLATARHFGFNAPRMKSAFSRIAPVFHRK